MFYRVNFITPGGRHSLAINTLDSASKVSGFVATAAKVLERSPSEVSVHSFRSLSEPTPEEVEEATRNLSKVTEGLELLDLSSIPDHLKRAATLLLKGAARFAEKGFSPLDLAVFRDYNGSGALLPVFGLEGVGISEDFVSISLAGPALLDLGALYIQGRGGSSSLRVTPGKDIVPSETPRGMPRVVIVEGSKNEAPRRERRPSRRILEGVSLVIHAVHESGPEGMAPQKFSELRSKFPKVYSDISQLLESLDEAVGRGLLVTRFSNGLPRVFYSGKFPHSRYESFLQLAEFMLKDSQGPESSKEGPPTATQEDLDEEEPIIFFALGDGPPQRLKLNRKASEIAS